MKNDLQRLFVNPPETYVCSTTRGVFYTVLLLLLLLVKRIASFSS
jgi:hypothetical protein